MEIVAEKKHMAVALVVERDGMVHVVSISKFGKLHLLENFDVVPSSAVGGQHRIMCFTKTKTIGEYFAGGSQWHRIVKVNVQ